MTGLDSALRFLVATTLRPCPDTPGQPIGLDVGAAEPVPALVYEPPGPARGAIVFVHGLSPVAHRDPRVCRAARGLSLAGYRVITPLEPDMQALRTTSATVDRVAQALEAVAARPELSGNRRLGLFSVCYSAGVALRAAARPTVREQVAAVCALGAYDSLLRWARHLLQDPQADDYARLILFYNHLDAVVGPRPALHAALEVALLDSWHQRPPLLPAASQALCDEDREILEAVMDPARRPALGQEMLRLRGAAYADMDVAPTLGGLRAPCVLLHATDDNVVPAQESAALHDALQTAGRPSHLLISPALGHAALAGGLRQLPEVVRVVLAFRRWFAWMDEAQRGA